jgi:hypothetical protein
MPKRPYPRWQRRHSAVLQWLLVHPVQTLNECARANNYSPSQISRIVNSPDFQRHYRIARSIIEEEITMSVIKRQQLPGD